MTTNWWTYVQAHAGTNATKIAADVGVSVTTVTRWQSAAPKPDTARSFALAYGRPVLEAFLAAGFLTPNEAGETVLAPGLDHLRDEELVLEILARLTDLRTRLGGDEDGPQTPIATVAELSDRSAALPTDQWQGGAPKWAASTGPKMWQQLRRAIESQPERRNDGPGNTRSEDT